MFPVLVLRSVQGVAMGKHAIQEANQLVAPLSVPSLIDCNDGLWGHWTVDEVRFGLRVPNAALARASAFALAR